MPLRLAINAGSRVYIKNLAVCQEECSNYKEINHKLGGTDVVYSLGNNQFGLGGYYRLGDAAIASLKYFSTLLTLVFHMILTLQTSTTPLLQMVIHSKFCGL